MLYHQNTSTTPYHPRRRHHSRREPIYSPLEPAGRASSLDGWSGRLDLSFHHPPKPFGNRFEMLSTLPELIKSHRTYTATSQRRHTRTRGTRGGKARRGKLDLQAFDERLSKDVDLALKESLDRNLLAVRPDLTFGLLQSAPLLPQQAYFPPPPTPPPQPPCLDFTNFRLDTLDKTYPPTPPKTPPLIPAWCPALPSLTGHGIWSDSVPTFFDLSSLPESDENPHEKQLSLELQLRRGRLDTMSRKSRFFPPRSLKTASELGEYTRPPTIKLPPFACKLHAPEIEAQLISPKPANVLESVEQAVACAKRQLSIPEALDACAANLWRILSVPSTPSHEAEVALYLASTAADTVWLATDPSTAEPEATELPYVHGISLTGLSNNNLVNLGAAVFAPYSLVDSGMYIDTMHEAANDFSSLPADTGIDENAYANDVIAAVNTLPMTPASPQISSVFDLRSALPVDELANSDTHFTSENNLFACPSTTASNCADDIIDVAEFLKMGHAKDCWCCGGVSEFVDSATLVEDDDWMVFSNPLQSQACAANEISCKEPLPGSKGPVLPKQCCEALSSDASTRQPESA